MKIKTNIKGGRLAVNHSQTRAPVPMKIKTTVKSSKLAVNHSQTRAR